jgi:hypothetical protein
MHAKNAAGCQTQQSATLFAGRPPSEQLVRRDPVLPPTSDTDIPGAQVPWTIRALIFRRPEPPPLNRLIISTRSIF